MVRIKEMPFDRETIENYYKQYEKITNNKEEKETF